MRRLTETDLEAFEKYFDEQTSSVANQPNTYLTWDGARLIFIRAVQKGFKYYDAKNKLKGKSVQDRVSVIQAL